MDNERIDKLIIWKLLEDNKVLWDDNFQLVEELDMLESSIQRYKDIDAWNATPVLTEESFNKLQDVMEEAGELEKRAKYSDVVNNKYAEEAVRN